MRKKDKEIKNFEEIEDVLNRGTVCRLAMCENDQPYVVPLCFGYENGALYLHCSREGKKLDILKKNNNVCFEIDIDLEVIKTNQACNWAMKYKSVIGFGQAVFIEDVKHKRKALDIIMGQFSDKAFEFPEEMVTNTMIIKIEIESITGKKSGV